jgi:hypothetical protein
MWLCGYCNGILPGWHQVCCPLECVVRSLSSDCEERDEYDRAVRLYKKRLARFVLLETTRAHRGLPAIR